MNKEDKFTFQQRATELMKALKRRRTKERQEELDKINEQLDEKK